MQYDFKVDLAIILSVCAFLWSGVNALISRAAKKHAEALSVHEVVFGRVQQLLQHSLVKARSESQVREYENDDPDLQASVRKYMASHWAVQTWGSSEFLPRPMPNDSERVDFLSRVQAEATRYQTEQMDMLFDRAQRTASPVFHLEDESYSETMREVMEHVGSSLSKFGPEVRHHWESAQTQDVQETRRQLLQLQQLNDEICGEPLEPDFDDHLQELLLTIRSDYRRLTTSNAERAKSRVQRWWWRARRAVRRKAR